MGRLVDEDDVIDIINFECGKWTGLSKTIEKEIKALPPAQPSNGACWGCQCEKVEKLQSERPKGEWILSGENTYTCSVCGKTIITNKDYIKEHKWCFGCGTKMGKRKGADG